MYFELVGSRVIVGGHVILKFSILTSESLNRRTEKFEDQKVQILIPSKRHTNGLSRLARLCMDMLSDMNS